MYKTRENAEKFIPIPRKGKRYIAVSSHEKEGSIPLSIVLRDLLGLVENRRELKILLNNKQVLINKKVIKNTNYPLIIFDILSLPSMNKFYRAVLKGKKICLEEIAEKETGQRIYKIENKKIIKGKKVQLNLNNGKNLLYEGNAQVGEFISIKDNDKKIAKKMSIEKGSKVAIVGGKYSGQTGKVKEIKENKAEIDTERGLIIADIRYLFLIE